MRRILPPPPTATAVFASSCATAEKRAGICPDQPASAATWAKLLPAVITYTNSPEMRQIVRPRITVCLIEVRPATAVAPIPFECAAEPLAMQVFLGYGRVEWLYVAGPSD